MATANPSAGQALSLEQLIALCEEIAALARAGVPLDQGLKELGRELPGRLGKVAHEMGGQLATGMTLDQVVARAGGKFPPGYEAVMQAGIRAGNLPGILQGMMHLARRTGELRRQIVVAAVNPLLVVAITYLLFVFWLNRLAPIYLLMAQDWEVDVGAALHLVTVLQATQWLWSWLVPLVIFIGLALSWRQADRGTGEWSLLDIFSLGIVRRIGLMRRAGQSAALCEQLAILLEHGLPLAESLKLISQTLTNRPLSRATATFAEQVERGERVRAPQPFPPLLACILIDGFGGRDLIPSLKQMAANYQDEARRRGLSLSLWTPVYLTLAIGTTLGLLHVCLTLGPWLFLMRKMAEP
jgi:general secretion pathway protein F